MIRYFNFRERIVYLLLLLVLLGCTSSGEMKVRYVDGAIPPEKAIETYRVANGFKIELFASEPLIANPTDMAVDEKGRVFVTEMIGYPAEMNNTGKVKLLLDTDGDGIIDKSINFADRLKFPNGVMAWRDGILVTDAPYVIFFKDVDGDGVADIRDTILSGFPLTSPHVIVNHPRYEMDNWIHLANYGPIGASRFKEEFGDRGEEISFWKVENSPKLPRSANSKNVRFKPDNFKLEMTSTRSQFGMAINEWGDRFLNSNAIHIYQEILKSEYIERNKLLAVNEAYELIYDHGRQAEVFQIRENPDLGDLNVLPQITTSTGGISYYSGGGFPPPYDKNVTFVTESAFNLVHSDKLIPSGVGYVAQRIEDGEDFLASTDDWARPVNTYVGPDGALYVLDFYQMIIEHPEFMAEEQYNLYTEDFYKGQQMGRIYRITPESYASVDWVGNLDLENASNEELSKYLLNNNSWWRGTAQRMLVDRKAVDLRSTLEEYVRTSKLPEGRLQTLWTLEGLDLLTPEIVAAGLRDEHPGVRRNAILLSERFLPESDQLISVLYSLKNDSNLKVKFQLLNTLGYLKDNRTWDIRRDLLLENIEDPWFRISAMTAEEVKADKLLKEVIKTYGNQPDKKVAYHSMIEGLSSLIGAGESKEVILGLIENSLSDNNQANEELNSAVLTGLIKGISNRSGGYDDIIEAEKEFLIKAFFEQSSESKREFAFQILKLKKDWKNSRIIEENVLKSLANAKDTGKGINYRAQMLEFLTLVDPSEYESDLKSFIVGETELILQNSAIKVFSQIKGNAVSDLLSNNWDKIFNENKELSLETFLTEGQRLSVLMEALQSGQIPKKDISLTYKPKLLRSVGRENREEVIAILSDTGEGMMDEKLTEYRKEALYLTENGSIEQVVKGAAIFKKQCSICHQIQGSMGVDYGPDLSMIQGWAYEDMLANILDPNLSIAQGFDLWSISLKNGEGISGIITAESQNSLEVQTGPATKITIMKDNIESKTIEDISAMPAGFENTLSPSEMSDLLLFLRKNIDDVIRIR